MVKQKNISILNSSFSLEEKNDLGDGIFNSNGIIASSGPDDSLYNFSTFTFTNCNQTGMTGPSLTTMKNYYNTYQNGNTTNQWINDLVS